MRRYDLSSLRILGSTGEPWNPEPWRWLFDVVGDGRLPIINYSGGTEVSGGLVAGNVLTPLKPAAFAGPPPGIAADVVDDAGQSGAQSGRRARRPRAMDRHDARILARPERYEQTYWSRFPGVWVHGDWAAIDDDGLWYILGRSDDTIKIAGKRLGPAEVESILVEHPAVLEAAAIGVPDPTEGTGARLLLRAARRPAATGARRRAEGDGRHEPRQADEAGDDRVRRRPAEDAQREGHASRAARRLSRRSAGDLSSLENPQAVAGIKRRGA